MVGLLISSSDNYMLTVLNLDELLQGSQRALAYERPHQKYTSSLQHWLAGNACIARKETAFLKNEKDLLTLSSTEDGVVKWLERTVCDKIVCRLGKGSISLVSNVYIANNLTGF